MSSPTSARFDPSPRSSLSQRRFAGWFDLRRLAGAALVVLALRLVIGLWMLPVSADWPDTPLEQQVGLWPGGAPLGQWLQRVAVMPWMRYDSLHYTDIVLNGYSLERGTATFHPLYQLMARLPLPLLGGNAPLALLLVSTLASIVLCVAFARYVAEVHAPELAGPAVWLLFVLPPAFILLAPYNEGTFLALAVGSVWAMQRERWLLAGLLGCLAALTRQQGLALALPLAWGLLMAWRSGRVRWWGAGAALLVPGGYGLFVLYRAIAMGDFEAVLQAQGPAQMLRKLLVSPSSELIVPGQRIAWPWEALIDQVRLIFTTPYSYHLVIDLVLGWAGVLVILLGLRSLTIYERLYSLAIAGLSLCYYIGAHSPYMSLPRHIMLAFPLYIVLARWCGQGRRWRALLVGGFLFNLLLAGLFVRRGWVP